jgi:hypothetical protein
MGRGCETVVGRWGRYVWSGLSTRYVKASVLSLQATAPGRGLRIARLQGEPDRPLMGRCESIDRSPTVMIAAHRAFLFISIRPPGPAPATAA